MEMIKLIKWLAILSFLVSCSDDSEIETGEIKTIKTLLQSFSERKTNGDAFVDARKILSRSKIDAEKIPVLFVELKTSGQNGTLTPYPGQGVGQTWLGIDGATITLNDGVLKASRGMGDDLMGSTSLKPPWFTIENSAKYTRELFFLNGKNQTFHQKLTCEAHNLNQQEDIVIWNVNFSVSKYEETCVGSDKKIKNTYFIDKSWEVRRSLQYHSETIGYLLIERLDRLK